MCVCVSLFPEIVCLLQSFGRCAAGGERRRGRDLILADAGRRITAGGAGGERGLRVVAAANSMGRKRMKHLLLWGDTKAEDGQQW